MKHLRVFVFNTIWHCVCFHYFHLSVEIHKETALKKHQNAKDEGYLQWIKGACKNQNEAVQTGYVCKGER